MDTMLFEDAGIGEEAMSTMDQASCSSFMPVAGAIATLFEEGELAEGLEYRLPIKISRGARTLVFSISPAPKIEQNRPLSCGGLACRQLKRVQLHIEQNIDQPIMLCDLAAIAGLSQSYFSRAFKISVGVTPHAYITRLRIERAKVLLADSEDAISDIALECGFSDQAHLSKRFLRSVGTSPARWRRIHRK